MEQNTFELTGKVTFIDLKYLDSGSIIGRILFSKKGKNEGEYDTYPVTLFGKTAEEFAEKIQKGDYANVKGRIGVNKYEKDGKKVERLELIAFEFNKAKYDTNTKSYVVDNVTTETKQEKPTQPQAKGDEVPW